MTLSDSQATHLDLEAPSEAPVPTDGPSPQREAPGDGRVVVDAGDPGSTPGGMGRAATHEPGRRPSFTITEAASACAVSRKTITRKLPELAINGAAKDEDGIWHIPVEALLAVGLHPGRSLAGEPRAQAPAVDLRQAAPETAQARPSTPDMVTIPRERWDDVRIRLARAEAEAAERGLALADARLALRALTAGPTPAGTAPVSQPAASEPAVPRPPTGVAGGAQGPLAAAATWDLLVPPAATRATPAGHDAQLPGGAAVQGVPTPPEGAHGWQVGEQDLFNARTHAARNATITAPPPPAPLAVPERRRRWWQARA